MIDYVGIGGVVMAVLGWGVAILQQRVIHKVQAIVMDRPVFVDPPTAIHPIENPWGVVEVKEMDGRGFMVVGGIEEGPHTDAAAQALKADPVLSKFKLENRARQRVLLTVHGSDDIAREIVRRVQGVL